jgi:hypothetical protein
MRANPHEARARPNDVSRGSGDGTAPRGRNASEQADREARAESNTAALESCTGLALGVINLPIDQVRDKYFSQYYQLFMPDIRSIIAFWLTRG